jgi:biotin carboxyl carrier protein
LAKSVKAQMPGTFYRSPDPDSDPYVEEGDSVSAGDAVGLIEVMKSFHEVKAGEDGTVSKILVGDEEAVDAGQDLVELD